jgi:hypothetical protein
MSWLYSQALVEEYLGDISSDGEQSVPLNGNNTQQAYCAPDKMTDFSRLSRFGMMYKPLTENRGQELLMLYLEGFLAKTSQLQDEEMGLTENDQECGITWHGLLAKYDPNTHLWRTVQCSLLEDLNESLQTLPKWGMTVNGELFLRPTWEQTTEENEYGLWRTPDTCAGGALSERVILKMASGDWKRPSGALMQLKLQDQVRHPNLWPTPRSCSAMAATITPESVWNENRNPNLETIVGRKMWGTPKAQDSRHALWDRNKGNLGKQVSGLHDGGKLNPTWVEWLMGWPLGWTDLKPLEMDKSHCVQQQHGES